MRLNLPFYFTLLATLKEVNKQEYFDKKFGPVGGPPIALEEFEKPQEPSYAYNACIKGADKASIAVAEENLDFFAGEIDPESFHKELSKGIFCPMIITAPNTKPRLLHVDPDKDPKLLDFIENVSEKCSGIDDVSEKFSIIKESVREFFGINDKNKYEKLKTTEKLNDIVLKLGDYPDNYQAICYEHAILVKLLCDRIGLKSRVITGAIDSEPHAWNEVEFPHRDRTIRALLDAHRNRIVGIYSYADDNHTDIQLLNIKKETIEYLLRYKSLSCDLSHESIIDDIAEKKHQLLIHILTDEGKHLLNQGITEFKDRHFTKSVELWEELNVELVTKRRSEIGDCYRYSQYDTVLGGSSYYMSNSNGLKTRK